MERRLPLLTDNHVRQPIVTALRARGWTVVRSIDVFPERTTTMCSSSMPREGGDAFRYPIEYITPKP